MALQIGDSVNWTNGGFSAGVATVIEVVDPADWPDYNAVTNPAYKIQFADGNWTIIDESNLTQV